MKYLTGLILALFILPVHAQLDWNTALQGEQRSAENKARDSFRHPRATLEFFGIEQGMTVVEVAPGGGWYTEILAPLMKDNGTFYAAHFSLNGPNPYYRNSLGKFLQTMAAAPEVYDDVIITQLQPPLESTAAPAGSADLVVTFRNVHSWMNGDIAPAMLAAIYQSLKPGGIFGLVQHRAVAGTSPEDMKKSGYVTEAKVIELATAAGFKLVQKSEINANAADNTRHPEGVWTLPPALRLGDTDREKYIAIGESDRMTMKFVKPL